MPKDFKDVFRDATELSEQDRATLAGLLIESLEGEPDPDVDPTVLGSWPLGVTRPSKFSPTHKTFWRPCESCGTVFEAGNSLSRFCSQRCSKREYRKVQRRARSSQ